MAPQLELPCVLCALGDVLFPSTRSSDPAPTSTSTGDPDPPRPTQTSRTLSVTTTDKPTTRPKPSSTSTSDNDDKPETPRSTNTSRPFPSSGTTLSTSTHAHSTLPPISEPSQDPAPPHGSISRSDTLVGGESGILPTQPAITPAAAIVPSSGGEFPVAVAAIIGVILGILLVSAIGIFFYARHRRQLVLQQVEGEMMGQVNEQSLAGESPATVVARGSMLNSTPTHTSFDSTIRLTNPFAHSADRLEGDPFASAEASACASMRTRQTSWTMSI